MEDKFHCIECGGFAKAKEETCNTCDGEGNELKTVKSVKPKKRK